MTDTLSISGDMFADVADVVERTDYSALLREFRYSIAREKSEMFENQADVHGKPWATLALSTIIKKGHNTILVETGALKTSLVDVDGEGNFNEVANKLDRAVAIFLELAPVLEAQFEAKITWSYGRNKVEMPNGSTWEVRAATPNLHGGTYDLIVVDEIWNVSEEVYFDALRPSQIAVKSPLLSSWSTSGDESSKTMQRLREAAVGAIDQGKQTRLYFAEWSLPSGASPNDEINYGYANPALGQTITLEALQAAAETPDRAAFLRAHLNLWVSSADAWIQPGVWDRLFTEFECPQGGVLAVDSSVDSSKYVGVRCGLTDEGNIIATIQFSTESLKEMWVHVNKAMDDDPKLRLAISPALDLHTPEKLERRRQVFGYAEVLKFTGLTRSLILEKRIFHRGEELLSSHVNRAVLARANGQVVISSQRSPGPIEAARLLVVAAALVSRPSNTGRAAMAFGR